MPEELYDSEAGGDCIPRDVNPLIGMGSHQSAKAGKAGKAEWLTPPHIMQSLGVFDLDPCSPINRPWDTAKNHLTIKDDGLSQEWSGRVWCNPPYGRETGKWLEKCADHGDSTVLIFARTETNDWVLHVWGKAHAILFLYGRLYFHHITGERGATNSGAPSALISYNKSNTEYLHESGIKGRLIILK